MERTIHVYFWQRKVFITYIGALPFLQCPISSRESSPSSEVPVSKVVHGPSRHLQDVGGRKLWNHTTHSGKQQSHSVNFPDKERLINSTDLQ